MKTTSLPKSSKTFSVEERNSILERMGPIIGWTIKKNLTLLKAVRADFKDVEQQLYLAAILAIDRYDPTCGAKVETWVKVRLQYEILNIREYYNCGGIKNSRKNTSTALCVSLDAIVEAGHDFAYMEDHAYV